MIVKFGSLFFLQLAKTLFSIGSLSRSHWPPLADLPVEIMQKEEVTDCNQLVSYFAIFSAGWPVSVSHNWTQMGHTLYLTAVALIFNTDLMFSHSQLLCFRNYNFQIEINIIYIYLFIYMNKKHYSFSESKSETRMPLRRQSCFFKV